MIKKHALLILLGVMSSYAIAQPTSACQSTSQSYAQCEFDIPALAAGQTLEVVSSSTDWRGSVVASCISGHVSLSSKKCAPADPNACQIGESIWGSSCKHDAVPTPLANGASIQVNSIDTPGSVSYSCSAGKLKIDEMSCEKPQALPSGLAFSQNVTTDTVTIPVAFVLSKPMTDLSSSYVLNQGIRACGNVDGFNASTLALTDISYDAAKSSPGNHVHYATCKTMLSLRCDQDYRLMHGPGSYDSRGEMGAPPSYNLLLNHYCNSNNNYDGTTSPEGSVYSSVTPIYVGLKDSGVTIDEYTAALICNGNTSTTSRCGSTPPITSAAVISRVLSCSSAEVYSAALTENPGTRTVESSMVLEHMCKALSFNKLDTFRRGAVVDEAASPRQYEVFATCSEYMGTEKLRPDCGLETVTTGPSAVSKTSCSTANVSGTIFGDVDPSSGNKSLPPSAGVLQVEFCQASGYDKLDQITSSAIDAHYASGDVYRVAVNCSVPTNGVPANCNASDPCRGAEIPADDPRPKLCEGTACYLNICAPPVNPPDDLCKDCEPTTLTFTDQNTGNTCNVFTPLSVSGATTSFDFDNGTHSGNASMFCNNGVSKITGGTCYKHCQAGVTLGWNDKNGNSSCSQVVPAGVYPHGETLSFSSSIGNTGSSSWSCDNGIWVNTGGSCLLDCSGPVSWGSGTAAGGQNKTNICGATPAQSRSGTTTPVSSSAPNTVGAASLTCNDGDFSVGAGATCNVGCPSQSVTWGGGACKATLSGTNHLGSQTLSHAGNATHPYPWSISGTASYSCGDGQWSGSGSCEYVVGESVGAWSSYADKGSPYGCSAWTPTAGSVAYNQPFTQTRTCSQDQEGSRPKYYNWYSGKTTNNGSETRTRTVTVSQSQLAVGTWDPVDGTEVGPWGDWVNVGPLYNCSAWSPSPDTVAQGEAFTQTSSCDQNQERSRNVYNVYASGRKEVASVNTESRTVPGSKSRTEYGTAVIGTPALTCPSGYSQSVVVNPDYTSSVKCVSEVSYAASCPLGYSSTGYVDASGNLRCEKISSTYTASTQCHQPSYNPFVGNGGSGYSATLQSDGNCTAPVNMGCSIDYGFGCNESGIIFDCGGYSHVNDFPVGSIWGYCKAPAVKVCNNGDRLSGSICQSIQTTSVPVSCPSGYSLNQNYYGTPSCRSVMNTGQYCPAGKTLTGGMCF